MADMSDFKKKLRAGDYISLTGAKRAIGKMKGWSESERDKARAAAGRHFEGSAPAKKAPVKKAAKKKGKRKLHPNNASKKTAKKAAAKAPVKGKKVAKKGKKAAKKVASVKQGRPAKSSERPSLEQRVALAHATVGTCAQALDTLNKCKLLDPNADVAAGVKTTMEGLAQLVSSLTQDVAQMLTPEQLKGQQMFVQVAPGGNGQIAPATAPPAALSAPVISGGDGSTP